MIILKHFRQVCWKMSGRAFDPYDVPWGPEETGFQVLLQSKNGCHVSEMLGSTSVDQKLSSWQNARRVFLLYSWWSWVLEKKKKIPFSTLPPTFCMLYSAGAWQCLGLHSWHPEILATLLSCHHPAPAQRFLGNQGSSLQSYVTVQDFIVPATFSS